MVQAVGIASVSRHLISFSALFVTAMLVNGCGKATSQAPMQRPPTNVSVAPVTKKDVPVYLDEIGRCTAAETVSIQPQAGGRIIGIHFADGANVKKGDKLFTIDPKPYEIQLQ